MQLPMVFSPSNLIHPVLHVAAPLCQPVADLEKYMEALSSKVTNIETMLKKIEGEFPKDTPSKEKLEFEFVQFRPC